MASSSSTSNVNVLSPEDEFMSNFSPSLIRRVLLTDAADFPDLTMSGHPRQPTVSFWDVLHGEGYVKEHHATTGAGTGGMNIPTTPNPTPVPSLSASASLSLSHSSSLDNHNNHNYDMNMLEQTSTVLHKAFHDALLHQLQTTTSYQPLHPLIVELYDKIRSLFTSTSTRDNKSNNTQISTIFQNISRAEEEIRGADGDVLSETLQWLIQIGTILATTSESEERSQSTVEWNNIATHALEVCSGKSDPRRKVSCMEEEEGMTLDFQVCKHDHTVNDDDDYGEESLENVEEELGKMHHVPVTLGYCEFAVASVSFLHKKVEQCQVDIMDFQLAHVIAPRMHLLGRDYMMKVFQDKFKNHHEAITNANLEVHPHPHPYQYVPHLKTWLDETVKDSDFERDELFASEEKRGAAVLQTGWVDNILFRSPRDVNVDETKEDSSTDHDVGHGDGAAAVRDGPSPFYMPEILYLDVHAVRSIRMTAKLSVVGSVLALHASTVAGGGHKLKADPLDVDIQECRHTLVSAMSNRTIQLQQKYEETIGDAVVHLARALKDDGVLTSGAEDTLRSRTISVMKMEDPVIKLLDDRMKSVFRHMMVFDPQTHQRVPTSIRTGRKLANFSSDADKKTTFTTVFKKVAKQEFISKGFSFYAEELADATLMACRIINLSLYLYGSIVEPVFLEALRSSPNV